MSYDDNDVYESVDIIISVNAHGGVEGVFSRHGGMKVAVVDEHWDDQDRLFESLKFSGMSYDEREKFKTVINTLNRHYHVSKGDGAMIELYKDLHDAILCLESNLEEADPKDNWDIFACVDNCEGVR